MIEFERACAQIIIISYGMTIEQIKYRGKKDRTLIYL